jgi:hypothetical protein
MDDVEIFYRYATGEGGLSSPPLVGVRGGFDLKVLNVNLTWSTSSADLSGSSNYKQEWYYYKILFGQWGQGFFSKGKLLKVRRS